MGESTFAPGEKVRVIQRGHWEPDSIETVKRVTKRFVELENGKKYSLRHGYPYGGNPYKGSHIAKTNPEELERLRENIRRHKALAALTSLRADDLKEVPTDRLVRAAGLISGEEQPEPEPVCWHCLDVLIPDSRRPRCERCPDECDVEGCEEPGCAGESDAD